MRRLPLALVLALLVVGPTRTVRSAEETPDAHEHGRREVIALDNTTLSPSTVQTGRDAVLVFENRSLHPIEIRFVDPGDAAERIHCRFAHRERAEREGAKAIPWALFGIDGGHLGATIPPGRWASVCSLDPGTYAFTATRVIPKAVSLATRIEKGQIVVR